MKLIHSVAEFRAARAALGASCGFVPTMGALHEGHLSLVRRAKAECGAAAVSIFVNPTQFNDASDFSRYPRTLEADMAKLAPTGCDLVFAPDAREMYPEGFATKVDVGPVTLPLEGAMRPGHFSGVATVVAKLLNVAQASRAYFGQKDAQQVVVIRQLVRDLNIPGEIIAVPTVREADGLAMSSRNVHLSPAHRASATVLYRALSGAQKMHAGGERDGEVLRAQIRQMLATEPDGIIEYVSIADPDTLEELSHVDGKGALASLAVRFGATRLIDNVVLT
jgi:pantoate--beta-alanine ligase